MRPVRWFPAQVLEQEPGAAGRLEMVELDVEDDASVAAAVQTILEKYGPDAPLYGLCNNAGIGFGRAIPETLSANFYSQKRVAEAFIPLLDPKEGRICNIASASGPNYVRGALFATLGQRSRGFQQRAGLRRSRSVFTGTSELCPGGLFARSF